MIVLVGFQLIGKFLFIGVILNEVVFYKFLVSVCGFLIENIINFIYCGFGFVVIFCLIYDIFVWCYVYVGEYLNQEIGFDGVWYGSEIGMVFGISEYYLRWVNIFD